MGKVLQFHDRTQRIEDFVEEVRRTVASFDGNHLARRQYITYIIRRCDALKIKDSDIALAQLENIFEGFLEDVGT
jgi:hypothetical protein